MKWRCVTDIQTNRQTIIQADRDKHGYIAIETYYLLDTIDIYIHIQIDKYTDGLIDR